MASIPINPTQLTPPRVPVMDERTGAISREWYRFFLSLLTATQANTDTVDTAPDSDSLIASLSQIVATVQSELQTLPNADISSIQNQLNELQNTFGMTPPTLLGSVTSVDASGGSTGLTFTGGPITTSGTLTLGGTLAVAYGGTGQTSYTNGQLLIGNTTGNTLTKATLTAGTNVTISNGAGAITINATDAFVGTVTSVSGSGGTTGLTLTGGPITTTGTLTLGGTLVVANGGTGTATAFTAGSVVFAGASGVYAQDNANLFWDDTNNRLGIGTTTPGFTAEIAGNIRVGAGGDVRISSATGTTTSGGDSLIYNDANDMRFATGTTFTESFRIGSVGQLGIGGATYGTSGQVLTSGGASAAPTWATPATGSVTSVSGTGTVNGITLTGTVTSSGSLTLGGTLSNVSLTTQVTGTLPVGNGGTGVTTSTGSGNIVLSTRPSFGSTIGVGGASASASGAGVSFPASQSASTDPNTLDDYEEGSCTITIQDSAGNSATMGGGNVFRYVKVGAFVQVSGTLNWTSIASLSAGSRIQFHGLPFVVNNVGSYRAPAIIGSSASGSFNITRAEIAAGADNGNTFIFGTKVSGNNVDGNMVPANLGSSGTIYGFQISYTTTF